MLQMPWLGLWNKWETHDALSQQFFLRQTGAKSAEQVTADADAEKLEFIEIAFKALLGRSPDIGVFANV